MTELFAIPAAAVSPDEAALRARLSPERLAYIDRLRGTARQQSFAASLLLDAAVRRHFPAVPRPLVLSAQANGKPYLSDSPEVHFSLSHSSDWAVCAVSNHPVGADIQLCDTGRRDVARRFFHPDEVRYLDTLSPAKRKSAFFRLWALKESFVKADGRGLRLLRHFCVDISAAPPRVAEQTACSLFEPAFPDTRYRLAVCVLEENAVPPALTVLQAL